MIKSGAYKIPLSFNACPHSSSRSTLLAAPAMILQLKFGIVSGFTTAPSAHGANTSHLTLRISSALTASASNSFAASASFSLL